MSAAETSIGLRVPVAAGVERGERLTFTFDGERIVAFRGESVAAALLAAGRRTLRSTAVKGEPRGVFCGMASVSTASSSSTASRAVARA